MAKKLQGKLNGPSHQMGGIKFKVGNEIQEAEGGEFVVKKNSVNSDTQALLEYINNNGRLPSGNSFKYGGLIKDARKRRK
jgi:hypothetical protein